MAAQETELHSLAQPDSHYSRRADGQPSDTFQCKQNLIDTDSALCLASWRVEESRNESTRDKSIPADSRESATADYQPLLQVRRESGRC